MEEKELSAYEYAQMTATPVKCSSAEHCENHKKGFGHTCAKCRRNEFHTVIRDYFKYKSIALDFGRGD